MKKAKAWQETYEPPEYVQLCLHCPRARCDNCMAQAHRRADGVLPSKLRHIKPLFLGLLKDGEGVTKAAKMVGIKYDTAKRWYNKEIERELAQRREEAEYAKAEEWRKIRRMLCAGVSLTQIANKLHIGKNWHLAKHAENYNNYILRQGSKNGRNTDGNTESNRKNRGKEAW